MHITPELLKQIVEIAELSQEGDTANYTEHWKIGAIDWPSRRVWRRSSIGLGKS